MSLSHDQARNSSAGTHQHDTVGPFAQHPILLPCLLLITAIMAAYSNIYDNPFLFDDDLLITLNTNLVGWGNLDQLLTSSTTSGAHVTGGFYRPLQMLLYAIIANVIGVIPAAFHVLNLALHAANACLMFMLGRRMGFNPTGVFMAALLWALHPIHTEAITYMSGTADPLATLFTLTATLLFLGPPTWLQKLCLIITLILGLLSKETAVMIPAIAFVARYFATGQKHLTETLRQQWFLWPIVLGFAAWRMTAGGFDGPRAYEHMYAEADFANLALYAHNWDYRLYTFLATLPHYLSLLLWPHPLYMERDFPVFVNPASGMVIAGLIIVCAGLWAVGKRSVASRPLGIAAAWFFVAHLPNSGLLVAVNSIFLEHWMYLPAIGLFLGGAESIHQLLQRVRHQLSQAVTYSAFVLALALGAATFQQNKVWADPITFYTHIFEFTQKSARAHNNLAIAYMNKGDYAAAVAEFQKAITITDTYAETRHNMAIALMHLPDIEANRDAAIKNLERSIEIDPKFYRSYGLLAVLYMQKGDKEKAAQYATAYKRLLPTQ